jgi:ABC-type uncharacterized transport system permease subunit
MRYIILRVILGSTASLIIVFVTGAINMGFEVRLIIAGILAFIAGFPLDSDTRTLVSPRMFIAMSIDSMQEQATDDLEQIILRGKKL